MGGVNIIYSMNTAKKNKTTKTHTHTKTGNYFRTYFHCLAHLLIHSPSHPSIHPSIHSFTHSLTHPLAVTIRPDMTEKLLTGTLSLNTTKSRCHQKGAEQWTILFNNTIHWQIKHFTVIYSAGNNNFCH